MEIEKCEKCLVLPTLVKSYIKTAQRPDPVYHYECPCRRAPASHSPLGARLAYNKGRAKVA